MNSTSISRCDRFSVGSIARDISSSNRTRAGVAIDAESGRQGPAFGPRMANAVDVSRLGRGRDSAGQVDAPFGPPKRDIFLIEIYGLSI